MLKLSALVRLLKPCNCRRGIGLTTTDDLDGGDGRRASRRAAPQRRRGRGLWAKPRRDETECVCLARPAAALQAPAWGDAPADLQ
jgi:hypothetical protein